MKKVTNRLRFFVLIILCNFLLTFVFSQPYQQAKKIMSEDELYNLPSYSLNIVLTSGFTEKAAIHKTAGTYDMKTTIQPYLEGGVDYQSMPFKSISLLIGFHVTATGRNAVFHVPVERINPAYKEPYPPTKFNDFDFGFSVPLLLQVQWRLPDTKAIYVQAGIQAHYSSESDISYGDNYVDATGNYIDVFDLNLNTNNEQKLWLTYTLGSGYQWLLKNKNLFKIGITANFSFTHFVSGDYEINIPGYPLTQGIYHLTGTYIGITANYDFVRFKEIDALLFTSLLISVNASSLMWLAFMVYF